MGHVDHGEETTMPATAGRLTLGPQKGDPTPLKAMGRFSHEAMMVDHRQRLRLRDGRRHALRVLPLRPGRPWQAQRRWPAVHAEGAEWSGERRLRPPRRHRSDLERAVGADQRSRGDRRRRAFSRGSPRAARGSGDSKAAGGETPRGISCPPTADRSPRRATHAQRTQIQTARRRSAACICALFIVAVGVLRTPTNRSASSVRLRVSVAL